MFGKLVQSLRDPRELQRNLKGFATLWKYLLRGSFGASQAQISGPAQPEEA
jgi:anaerobic magnesium-protoporphyrin IX monomethyl ester cyclase